jgi:glycosyltransferase involved in cell wall biosynthesis
VYNRPEEIRELLQSLDEQTYDQPFEIVVVEDGSTIDSEEIIRYFRDKLHISYYKKPNTGPGDSRNYGMQMAQGDYFIVLDSDCVLPPQYLQVVEDSLNTVFVHCYGGPDAAHPSFSKIQKAINYAMTSFMSTGGIRGNKRAIGKFQPRSFNMGISKTVFEKVGGFGNIHPGEDPDLTFRIWEKGYDTQLIPGAFVYHKRRIDWKKFLIQVTKFGMVRPILNRWHPGTDKLTYWFPSLFCAGYLFALAALFYGIYWPILLYAMYYISIFFDALFKTKNAKIAFLSLVAVTIQFVGYGKGFLISSFWLTFGEKEPEDRFPKLFFKTEQTT